MIILFFFDILILFVKNHFQFHSVSDRNVLGLINKLFDMKINFLFVFILIALSAKGDYWTQKSAFPAMGRSHPYSFSIGTKGYVGSGDTQTDFWEFDPSTNQWSQKANFGLGFHSAASFTINGRGYVAAGSGYNSFWEYNPVTNIWVQKANFWTSNLSYASGFAIGSKGYVACGWGNAGPVADCWEYDATGNSWSQKANIPVARGLATGFALNGKGYICTGEQSGAIYLNDLWEYDPLLNTWTQRANFPGVARNDAAAFSICDKGYVGIGGELPFYNDFWQYNPATNQWLQKTSYGGIPRDDAAYFSIGTKGYIGLGQGLNNVFYLDFWEYTPDSVCATEIEKPVFYNFDFQISPNPVNEKFMVTSNEFGEKVLLKVFNAAGKEILSQRLTTNNCQLTTANWPQGIYTVQLTVGNKTTTKKFVKQ